MDNFIDQFYDLYLKNESFPFGKINKEAYQQEWGLYNMLYENLPEKYKKIFKEYIRAREDREREEKKATVLEVRVADSDMGKVIGKQGRIAKAIRSVVKAAAAKEDKKVVVDIMD